MYAQYKPVRFAIGRSELTRSISRIHHVSHVYDQLRLTFVLPLDTWSTPAFTDDASVVENKNDTINAEKNNDIL